MKVDLQNRDTRRIPTKLSRQSGFSSRIGVFPPNLGQLDTLQGFWGGPGACSPGSEKIRNLTFSNCWKCIQIVNPVTTTLFLYNFKSFAILSGGPFWLLGGCMRPPLPTGLHRCLCRCHLSLPNAPAHLAASHESFRHDRSQSTIGKTPRSLWVLYWDSALVV